MALLTEKAIMSAFEEMLEEMPFEKITVSSLVKRSGVSSNTFYYHYQDIYALLHAWLLKKLDEMKAAIGDSFEWKVDFEYMLHYCQSHAKLVNHIFKSLSLEQLERYIFSDTDVFFLRHIRRKAGDRSLDEEKIEELARFCKFAYMGYFIRFLWNNMEGTTEGDVDRLAEIMENFAEDEIRRMTEGSSEEKK